MDTAQSVIAAPRFTKADETELTGETVQGLEGMNVTSLHLLPPPHVAQDATVGTALQIARGHNGDPVLVLKGNKPVAFLDMADLAACEADGMLDRQVNIVAQPFAGSRDAPLKPESFRIITPETPLTELYLFLKEHSFAIITDAERNEVLGVVSQGDLDRFMTRLGVAERPVPLGRRADEEVSRDRSLVEFLHMLDGYAPLVRICHADRSRTKSLTFISSVLDFRRTTCACA